jgi:hypothetical protein
MTKYTESKCDANAGARLFLKAKLASVGTGAKQGCKVWPTPLMGAGRDHTCIVRDVHYTDDANILLIRAASAAGSFRRSKPVSSSNTGNCDAARWAVALMCVSSFNSLPRR